MLHVQMSASPVSFADMPSKSLIDDIDQGRERGISESVPTCAVSYNISCLVACVELRSLFQSLEKNLDEEKEPSLLKGGVLVLVARHLWR